MYRVYIKDKIHRFENSVYSSQAMKLTLKYLVQVIYMNM